MTNEEKAEYLESFFKKVCHNVVCPKEVDCTTCRINVVKGIELGLAEGERIGKEKQWIATERAQKKTSAKIKDLEKENAELKASLEEKINFYNKQGLKKISEIAELQKENAELKESIKNYVEGYEHLISTYKEQIETMKCCGNCLNRIDGQEFKDGCKVNWNCEKYNNWRFENE